VCRLEFSILEPMMFRSSGEFDPLARGVQASASSYALPPPSTIAGTVATLILEKNGGSSHGEGWVEEYLSILGSDITFRCPFMEVKNELYVEDKALGGLVKLEEVINKVRKISRLLSLKEPRDSASINKNLKFFEEISDFSKCLEREARLKHSERVGVGLKVRPEGLKIVGGEGEGLLYSASFIDYSPHGSPKVKILADARGKVLQDVFSGRSAAPVRFGGEGRFSLLTISVGSSILDRLKREVWDGEASFKGLLGLYVCSPALFRCGSSVEDSIRKSLEGRGLSLKMLYGETEILGVGFSLPKRRRKPIYGSLKPGSIVFAEAESCELEELYWSGLGGVGVELGYGTVIPAPL